MGTIFMISPSYLEAAFNEAKQYDFFLQGYGSFSMGLQGFTQINLVDLLGIVFLVENESYLLKNSEKFLKLCNSMESNKKVLVVSQSDLSRFKSFAQQFSNLRFSYLPNVEVITDDVINRQIFGSILLDNFKPYKIESSANEVLATYHYTPLNYKPLISVYLLDCISKVVVLDSLKKTLLTDKVYQQYVKDKSFLTKFRECYIRKVMNLEVNLEELKQIVEFSDINRKYLYYGLIRLIENYE